MSPIPQTLKTCSIAMRFNPEALQHALDLLLLGTGPIRAKRGCRSCRVERDASEEGLVRYSEEWESDEAFGRHLQSEEFWRVLLAMDMCSEEPEVAIGALSAQYGLEALQVMRERHRDSRTEVPVPKGKEQR